MTKGWIEFQGQRIEKLTPADLVKRGVVQVMEGRHCFQHLTVEENLLTGAYTRSGGIKEDLEKVYAYFPRLKERRNSQSGYTSGGEQQMTAIGRALMARPKMILLDEPSMGLAPQLVEEIFGIVKELNQKEKVSFLLAEQNTHMALKYADYGYILENGRVVMDGEGWSLAENEDVKEFYLGFSSGGRKSFRDVKSYRRRKRWLRALFAAGFRPGDLALGTFSYHFTPAGSMLESGALALGCAVLPGGTGQTEIQVQTIAEARCQPAYVGTPSLSQAHRRKGRRD